MRRLLLIRHGPAAGKAADGSDRERPLTPEGRRSVEALAGWLAAEGIAADFALCSAARRASETLDILVAGGPGPRIEREIGLYLADARSLLQRLCEVPAEVRSLLLVGHNPGLQDLTTLLAGESDALAHGLPAAGAAAFDIDGDWSELGPRTARLRAFYSP